MLVDDNDFTRAGYASVLAGSPAVDLVATLDHREALGRAADWASTDVVVVDAADEGRPGDQFPGVEVVRHIRACAGDAQPVIVVITGHFMHDGLRYRMAAAGADFYFFRGNLRSSEDLLAVVLHPERFRRGVPSVADKRQQRRLGVKASTKVEGLLAYVGEHKLASALDPRRPVRPEPKSRKWVAHRRAITAAGNIEAVNMTTGEPPCSRQTEPSWRQLRSMFSWLARVDDVDEGHR